MFADVANYTGLMGQDEIGTWSTAKSRFRDFNELAKLHYGDVLEVRGDGLVYPV